MAGGTDRRRHRRKARALYGDRYAEFLDCVQAYACFPYAVAKDVADFRDGEISVRFEGISGRNRPGGGNPVQPQAERRLSDRPRQPARQQPCPVEVRERRALLGEMDSRYSTPSRQWHDLWLRIASTKVEGYLDGKLYLEYNLSGARWWTHRPCGRIGLWSKADSQMHLDDYTLTPAAMSPKDMQRAVLGPCVQGAA